MTEIARYSVRLLNPFQGMAKIIDTGEGRAVSSDGLNWRIQIKSEIYKSPWSSLGITPRHARFCTYGVWSRNGGLARVPIHPTLYQDHVEEVAGELVRQLATLSETAPFTPTDNIELWLLDSSHREPVVLIASANREDALPAVERLHWSPLPANAESFDSKVFREQQRRATAPLHIRDILTQVVRRRTGSPAFGQWFRRHGDGSATALQPFQGQSAITGEHIEAERFPELLIAGDWNDEREQRLMDDYLAWLSPYLLTLVNISDATRARLESHAVQRATEVEKLYRLYPRMIDEPMIKSALVEAVMRRSV